MLACSGTPSPGNTISSASSVAPNGTVNLSLQNFTNGTGVTYQWQSAPSNTGPWTNFGTNSASQTSPAITSTIWFRSIVTCSGNSGTSNPVQVTVSHCTPVSTNTSDYISGFTTTGGVSNISNTPTVLSAAGYGNFFATQTVSQFAGSAINFTETYVVGSHGFSIWVDFNNNFIFETSERLFNAGALATGHTGSFTIPGGTPAGDYRMRIRAWWNNLNPDPCTSIGFGEAEDYKLTVLVSSPCSGTPSPGNTISSASSVAPNGTVNLSLQNLTTGTGVTYQWQSAPSSTGPWTNFGTSSASQTSPAITSSIWFRSIVTCSGNSGTSNPVQVNVSYCTPTTTNTSDYISGFTTTGGVANIANSPTVLSGTGYGDFFATQTVSQFAGSAINFTETYVGGSHGFSIWVDFNNNFIFETSERLFNAGATATGHTGSFTIPGGTPAGDYRMRIRAWWNNLNPDPCALISWGEAEDYRLTVLASTPCTGTPSPGNTVSSLTNVAPGGTVNLSLQNLTAGTGVTYQWQSAPSNSGPWTNFGTSVATQTSPVINAETWFRCIVTCSGNSGTSSPVQVTLTYCTYNTSVSDVTGITSVVFNTISNASVGDPAYTNFTAQSTSVTQGDVHTLSVRVNTDGSWTVNVRAWIDWNQNLQFEASEEYVLGNAFNVTNGLTSLSPLSITVPLTALPGNTRMRVVAAEISDPQPLACGTQFYGEAEDYTINVIPVVCSTPPTSISNTGTYCLGNQITLSVTGGTLATGSSWEWFTGSCGGTAVGTGNSITVSPTSTTQYFVRASASGVCPATTCANGTVTLPTQGAALGNNGENATCTVTENNWVHFYHSTGRLLASINSGGQNLGNVTVTSYVDGANAIVPACDLPSVTTAVLQRHWVITPQFQPASNVLVRLPFGDAEVSSLAIAAGTTSNSQDNSNGIPNLKLSRYHGPSNVNASAMDNCSANGGNGNTEIHIGSANGTTNGYSNVLGEHYNEYSIPEFSEFWLHWQSDNSPLPVVLSAAHVECLPASNQVVLQWATSSELNSDKFLVQRSRDGELWETIGQEQGAGNSSSITEYTFTDLSAFAGQSYYRIIQHDFDGTATVYGPWATECSEKNGITVYPNPTAGKFVISISSEEDQKDAILEIMDLSGKIISSEEVQIESGTTEIYIDLSDLNAGTYLIIVRTTKGVFSPVRVVKGQ